MFVPRTFTSLSSAQSSRLISLNWRLLLDSTFSVRSTTSQYFFLVCKALPDNYLNNKNRFVSITPLYSPTSSGQADNIFITRSYDATSHFETVVEDVQDVWKRVIGSDLVLKKREVEVQEWRVNSSNNTMASLNELPHLYVESDISIRILLRLFYSRLKIWHVLYSTNKYYFPKTVRTWKFIAQQRPIQLTY